MAYALVSDVIKHINNRTQQYKNKRCSTSLWVYDKQPFPRG
jgi:hypothetical protein